MSTALLQRLEAEVDERQNDLNNTLLTLEKYAARESGYSKAIRISIIFLGSLSATNAAAAQLGGDSPGVLLLYSLVGLLIATLGGIEAAFGFQKKAGELRELAADCSSRILDIDCKIPRNTESPIPEQLQSVRELLALQNRTLQEIQGKAAKIGVSITRKIRTIETGEEKQPASGAAEGLLT